MNRKSTLIGSLLTLAVWIISGIVYQRMPQRIPIHWNLQGEVDGYGDKLWGSFLVPSIMVGVLILAIVLPRISPRQFVIEPFAATYGNGMLLALGCVGYLQLVLLWGATSPQADIGRAMLAGLCFFWILFGNLMGKIRRNFWMGIRTPWTLASDRVWNETHRMAGKLFLISGLAGLGVLALGLKSSVTMIIVIALIVGNALIAVAYSLLKYRSLERLGKL